MKLTTNQSLLVETLPATAREVASRLGYSSTDGFYKLKRRVEQKGYRFESNDGVWSVVATPEEALIADGGTDTVTLQDPIRTPLAAKSTITKEANDFLYELELAFRQQLQNVGPVKIAGGKTVTPDAEDIVMFRTDDHFGGFETETNIDGEVVVTFSSEIAERRVFQHLDEVLIEKRERELAGHTVEGAYLLMNGDHVTGEVIYKGQQFGIDEPLDQQIARASRVYLKVIQTLSANFDHVTVVCQHGNHGELNRSDSVSSRSNADDLLYDALKLALSVSEIDNVEMVVNNVSTHTNFRIRGHVAHMRHGQDTLGHVGTNSAKKRWQSWLLESFDEGNPFDIAFVGHYHELKQETIAGRPVFMGGTLQPGGDYENSLGIAPGRPGAYIIRVTDDEAWAGSRPVYF